MSKPSQTFSNTLLEGGRHVGRPIASAIISLQVTDLEPKSIDVDPLIKVLDYA